MIFFSAWLSHVPASRFGQFWQLLGSLLARNGRVLFIDEHVDERGKEAYVAGRDEVIERRLRDGSTFRVIKNFVDPAELELRLRRVGLGVRDPSGRQRLGIWRGTSRELVVLSLGSGEGGGEPVEG